ncbi:MAG: hypothetical protein WDM84_08355 [Bauldia sp.]
MNGILFRREAPRRHQRHAGRDDEGLFVPSSTSPIASMARLSIWPFSANFEKS